MKQLPTESLSTEEKYLRILDFIDTAAVAEEKHEKEKAKQEIDDIGVFDSVSNVNGPKKLERMKSRDGSIVPLEKRIVETNKNKGKKLAKKKVLADKTNIMTEKGIFMKGKRSTKLKSFDEKAFFADDAKPVEREIKRRVSAEFKAEKTQEVHETIQQVYPAVDFEYSENEDVVKEVIPEPVFHFERQGMGHDDDVPPYFPKIPQIPSIPHETQRGQFNEQEAHQDFSDAYDEPRGCYNADFNIDNSHLTDMYCIESGPASYIKSDLEVYGNPPTISAEGLTLNQIVLNKNDLWKRRLL